MACLEFPSAPAQARARKKKEKEKKKLAEKLAIEALCELALA